MGYANAPFSSAEYARRLAKMRRAMERQGIDVPLRHRSLQHGLADRL